MAWKKSTTIKHTCEGPVFGRKTAGCPRCDELLAGAEPVGWFDREQRRKDLYAIRDHCCVRSNCGPVCTFGDW